MKSTCCGANEAPGDARRRPAAERAGQGERADTERLAVRRVTIDGR